MNAEEVTESVQPPETEAEQLRNRAEDLGMFAWGCAFLFVAGSAAGGYGLVNAFAWWPIAASCGALAFTLALALFLFAHLLHIRAALADRK